jgi:CBS domain-containing protein
MKVRDLMSAPPHTCQPHSDLSAVTQVMWDRDCGFVPVVDAAGHVVGVITDRDVCVATATRRKLPEHISAAQAMATSVHACLPDDSIEDVLALMKQFQVRRVPVIDSAGQLLGVLSMNDIVRAAGRKGGPTAGDIVAAMGAICAPRALAGALS